MLIYGLIITATLSILFMLILTFMQSGKQHAHLRKRMLQALYTEKNQTPLGTNKSPLTDVLSKKIDIYINKFVPDNIIKSIDKKILTAAIPGFSISQYFLMKLIIDGFIIIFLPLYNLSCGKPTNFGFLLLFLIGGFFFPDIYLNNMITKRQQAISKALPNFIDVLRICVEAGLDLEHALEKIADKDTSLLRPEIRLICFEVKMGKPIIESLQDMSSRLNHPDFAAFVTILLQAQQMGISIASVLRSQAHQINLKYIQGIRAKAAKVPVLILVPLVFFVLPALLVVILGPAILQIMKGG